MTAVNLPANAPAACPVCGGRWSQGYATIRERTDGPRSGKKIPVVVLVCESPTCGLGKFIGPEIEKTTGLREFNLKHKHRRGRDE